MKRRSEHWVRKVFNVLLKIFLLAAGCVLLMFTLIYLGVFGELPSTKEIRNPDLRLATEIISSDGVTLGKLADINRTPIDYDAIPKKLINALIATEDERFFSHSGIDLRSTARAILKPGTGGASTITQQLAKNLFTEKVSKNFSKRVIQKMKEWIVAIKIEKEYSKEEILALYLNTQDFVFNAVGIRSASRIYFSKEPKELNIQEAAVIVAMLKNPVLYNPNIKRFKNKSLSRRNIVFKQMARNNYITNFEKDSLQNLPLEIHYKPETHYTGKATYFRSFLKDELTKWSENYKKKYGKGYDIYEDGLKVYVTINSKMQDYAEEAVSTHMANLQHHFNKEQSRNRKAPFYNLSQNQIENIIQNSKYNSSRYYNLKRKGKSDKEIDSIFNLKTKMTVFTYNGEKDTVMSPIDSIRYYKSFLRSGLLSIEPSTGHVKTWVGGIDFKYFKYDAVEKQKRQVGSTFKPFVYATAIEKLGLSPCFAYPNEPYTVSKEKYAAEEDWIPTNSNDNYGGFITLKTALSKSVNVVSARLIDTVTPKSVVNLAYKVGIKNHIPEVPAISLGSVELTLKEMVSSYTTFANKGVRVEPLVITKIEDKNGRTLETFIPEKKKVISEQTAYIMLDLLKEVTQRGSGARLRTKWTSAKELVTGFPYNFKNPIAGKTGTSQNQSDGWFIGIVPNLVTGVWTGGENRAIHFRNIHKGQGATMSLPSWALFMQKCYADNTLNISTSDFKKPANFSVNLDCPELYNVSNKVKKIGIGDNFFKEDTALEIDF